MGKFVGGTRFSDEDLARAREMSTLEVISARTGFNFKRVGYEYHAKEHNSLVVFSDQKGWAWYSRIRNGEDCKGNNAISYLMKIEGLSFQDAVCELITPSQTVKYNPVGEQAIEKPKILELPPKAATTGAVEKYLVGERMIHLSVVKHCINYGYLYQDQRNNCVFVGRDEQGNPKYASKRGTYNPPGQEPYKRDCAGSSKMYGFLMEGTCKEHIFVFEAPIDVLSHATLTMDKAKGLARNDWPVSWQRHTRLALGGVSDNALQRYLITHPNIVKTISFCLDNDEAGQTHAQLYKEKYENEGFKVNIFKPPEGMGKDYNEYLQNYTKQKIQRQTALSRQTNYSASR